MAYSLWVPQALIIVRATGFTEGRPVDRTRSLNTHRDLSSNVFLEDEITLLDVAVGREGSTLSTFVITTTEASKDAVAGVLKDNYLGGPFLGLGSLRIEGILRRAQDYNTRHPLEGHPQWPRPLFYVNALSGEDELPPVVERAHQQLRMASCCAYNTDSASMDLVDNGLLTPEEHVATLLLNGYVSALVRTSSLAASSYDSTNSMLNYWDSAAVCVNKAVRSNWVFNPQGLQSAMSEMCELPVDRVLSLLKKSIRKALRDPQYTAPRKHRIRDDKKALEAALAFPLDQYIARSNNLLLGAKLVTTWVYGGDFPENDGRTMLDILTREEDPYSYVVDNLHRTLGSIYLAVPEKPNDLVARFIVDKSIEESRAALSARGFDLSRQSGAEVFKKAASLGPMLPKDVKDTMLGHMDSFMSDVALACKDVLDGGNGSVSNVMSVIRSAKQCGLLK